jgi:hypothetical protein
MGKKKKKSKERRFGKQPRKIDKSDKEGKKHFIDPKHKSTIWTVIIVIILIIFFIINNTRETPAEGPYPPNYNPENIKPDSDPNN